MSNFYFSKNINFQLEINSIRKSTNKNIRKFVKKGMYKRLVLIIVLITG